MIPSKYLYTVIGSLVLALASLYGSTLTKTVTRVDKLEEARATHDEELKQIHQDLEEIKEILRANHRY